MSKVIWQIIRRPMFIILHKLIAKYPERTATVALLNSVAMHAQICQHWGPGGSSTPFTDQGSFCVTEAAQKLGYALELAADEHAIRMS